MGASSTCVVHGRMCMCMCMCVVHVHGRVEHLRGARARQVLTLSAGAACELVAGASGRPMHMRCAHASSGAAA